MKEKKKNSMLRRMILLAAVFIFCYSGYQIIFTLMEYRKGEKEYQQLEAVIFHQEKPTEKPEEQSSTKQTQESSKTSSDETIEETTEEQQEDSISYIDFEALKSINSDAKAWIILKGTNINYPVVQAEDNDYYLRRTIYHTKNTAGTLFIDANIKDGMEGKNVIIYGHNMRDGSMFGTLSYYKKKSMFDSYPTFEVYTESGSYQYAVFAAFITQAGSDVYTYGFASEESFSDYIERVKGQSLYDTGVEVTAEDKIITLSTCSGKNNDRFVILAKRITAE